MEQKLQNRYGRWGRALCFALALALAALLSLTALPLTGMVYADDDASDVVTPEGPMPMAAGDGGNLASDPCELKVSFQENSEVGKEENLEPVTIDLYRIATAEPVQGYNIYGYKFSDNQAYDDAIKAYTAGNKDWVVDDETFRYAPDGTTDPKMEKGWAGLTEKLTEVLFTMENRPEPAYSKPIGTAITGIEPGLYLMVPHGSLTNYKVQAMDDDNTPKVNDKGDPQELTGATPSYMIRTERKGANGNTETVYSSIAVSPTKVYTFTPQLVSLPGLERGATNTGTDAETGLAPGWTTSVDAFAKAGFFDRYASLKLAKTLKDFNGSAVFMFEVDITTQTGQVFIRNIPMTFDGEGSKYVTLSDVIPMGSKVTVSEIYEGAKYEMTNSSNTTINPISGGTITLTLPNGDKQIIFEAGQALVTASFENQVSGSATTGTGIVNHFESIPDNARSGYTWNWTQIGPVNP